MTPLHRFRHPALVGFFAIAAAVVLVYSAQLGHNFLFDEEHIVVDNPLIRSFETVPKLFTHGYFYHDPVSEGGWQQYYRPLTSVTFAVDYFFWKWNPLGYNLTNVFLHVLLCTALFRLLARIVKSELAAFLAALLFSVHTIHTESVTYIASRGDLLGTLLMLCVLLLHGAGKTWPAAALYFLSLFCKESGILIPIYLAAYEIAFRKAGPRELVARLWPYAIPALAFMAFRKLYVPVPGPPHPTPWRAALRLASMGPPVLEYLRAMVLPEAFRYCEDIEFAKSWLEPRVFTSAAVFGLLGLAWLLAARRRGAAFFGMTIFLIGMGPYMQIIPFYPQWAEHYFLIPSVGLTVLLAVLWREILSRRAAAALFLAGAVYVAFFAFFCVRTVQRNAAYDDTERFYELLSESPSRYSYYGYLNLGRIRAAHGEWEKAGVFFRTALDIEEESEPNLNNMGSYWMQKHDYAKAYGYFKRAYELGPKDVSSLQNAAAALLGMGRLDDAIAALKAVQKKKPRSGAVYLNLLHAHELKGRPREGIRWVHRGMTHVDKATREVLRMAIVQTAYRCRWDEFALAHAARLERNTEFSWFSQAGRVVTGRLPVEEYLSWTRRDHKRFQPQAVGIALMAHVLAGRREEAARLLESRRSEFLDQPTKDPRLLRSELARAS